MDGIWVTAVAALIAAALSLLGVILNAVITRSTTHTNANLQRENEKDILELKTTINRTVDLYTAASASFTEGQKAAIERKLGAIDRLWDKILTLRNSLPPASTVFDLMDVSEYKNKKDLSLLQALTEGLSSEGEEGEGLPEKIASLSRDDAGPIEQVRPYVGEWMWALFFCYHAVLIRRLFMLHGKYNDIEKLEWYKNQITRQIIKVVLTPDEFNEFDQVTSGKWSYFQRQIESKILIDSRRVISGEVLGIESLGQARLIQQTVVELQQQDDKSRAR